MRDNAELTSQFVSQILVLLEKWMIGELEYQLPVDPFHMQLLSSFPTSWDQLTTQKRPMFGACEWEIE